MPFSVNAVSIMEYPFELPLHITELESPEGFQVWEREMH